MVPDSKTDRNVLVSSISYLFRRVGGGERWEVRGGERMGSDRVCQIPRERLKQRSRDTEIYKQRGIGGDKVKEI